MEDVSVSAKDSTKCPIMSNICTRSMAEFGNATVSTLFAKPNFTLFIATVVIPVVFSLEEDVAVELLDFAELEDATTEFEEAATLELDCMAELLDFAELEDATTEFEETATLELDCIAELLDFAELEDATTELEEDSSELEEAATLDDEALDELLDSRTTLILPVTVETAP